MGIKRPGGINAEVLSVKQAIDIIKTAKDKKEAIELVLTLPARKGKHLPPPPGCISLRGASRKYNISPSTISGWLKKGWVAYCCSNSREKYLQEDIISGIAQKYNKAKGRGKRTIKAILKDCSNN